MLTAEELLAEARSVEHVVNLAVGAASMCWDPPPSIEVFQSDEAGEIADALVVWLKDHEKPNLGLATTEELLAEIRVRTLREVVPPGVS